MRFHVVTIFPEMFDSYLKESILGRAIKDKKISVKFYNPIDYCKPKEHVDGRPYGGGPGMVLRPEFFLKSIEKAFSAAQKFSSGPRISSQDSASGSGSSARPLRKLPSSSKKIKIIIFSPSGKKFDTSYAKTSAKKYTDIIMISGRYEGIDARVQKIFKAEPLSIGDYVLTGGEIPAMALIDSISRQVPGVLGKYDSLEEERVSSSEVYTRPEKLVYKDKSYKVPKVLLSGNHKLIDEWKTKTRK